MFVDVYPWPNPPQFFSWIRSGLPQQSRAELITHVRQWPVCSCCMVATVLLRSSWFPWTIVEFSPARKWWFGKEISFQTPCGFIFRFHNYAGIQWFCSHPEIPHIFTWRFLSWTVAEAHQCFLQNIIVCIFFTTKRTYSFCISHSTTWETARHHVVQLVTSHSYKQCYSIFLMFGAFTSFKDGIVEPSSWGWPQWVWIIYQSMTCSTSPAHLSVAAFRCLAMEAVPVPRGRLRCMKRCVSVWRWCSHWEGSHVHHD